MMRFNAFSGRWLTSLLLLILVNGLLITHDYPLALILLVNLTSALWFLIETYRDAIAKRNTINLIDTLLISLRQGEYAIRANEAQDSALSSTVEHLNALATKMQRDQRLVTEQQDLLAQIIEKVDFALLVFNEHSCIFRNQYAAQTFDASDQSNMWAWYKALLANQQQGKVALTINGKQHAFLIEQSHCRIGEQNYVLLVLKQLDSILYQQEKDALKKFVRILSHEINNTLAPIGTVARSLNKRLANDIDKDSFATGLTLINERANYLKSFMDNYVSLAKLPAAHKNIESCDTLCEQLTAIYPDIKIQYEQSVFGFFDISQIKQVLCHLINNAREASSPSPRVFLKLSANDTDIIFDVIDTGPGFSNLEDAGTAFYTTKSGGNGIGLMLSRVIIENHGSVLKLQNHTEGGAWVQFALERVINNTNSFK